MFEDPDDDPDYPGASRPRASGVVLLAIAAAAMLIAIGLVFLPR